MKAILIDNIAAHYRAPIYQLLDKEIGLDFVVGDKQADIKKMDYSLLKNKVTEVHNVYFPHGYYQRGVPKLMFSKYDTYIFLGDMRCVSNWLLLITSLFFKKKQVYLWSHGQLGKEGKLNQLVARVFYGMADGAFIYNERSTHLLASHGVREDKLHTIYNSLNYDAQLPIRQSLCNKPIYQEHFGNSNSNIVFIGRLTTVKRFDLLIEAVSILKQRGERLNVTFIGDGVERKNMETMVADKDIKNQVWFYGACYDEKTNAELIYNADLCVSPGNIGLTAMHVLMFGCPAITNDDFNHQMPEFEAIKTGKTGDFFKADSSSSLADVISKWFKEHGNEREKVRQACYKEIDEKWNPHHQIEIFKSVLGA